MIPPPIFTGHTDQPNANDDSVAFKERVKDLMLEEERQRVKGLRNGQVCGDCKHWFSGECFRYPPQMATWPNDNQPTPTRPSVAAADRACGEFQRLMEARGE